MTNKIRRFSVSGLIPVMVIIFFEVSNNPSFAQQNARVAANTNSSNAVSIIHHGKRNEPPRAIEFKERLITTSSLLKDINIYLGISSELSFKQVDSNSDELGMNHYHLQQIYKGIPIEGLEYRVHERDGFVTSMNGKAIIDINLDTTINLSAEQAFSLAVNYLKSGDTTLRPAKMLIVSKNFTFEPGSFSIAYQFDINVSFIEAWRISIDAKTGEVLNKVSLVNNCFKEKRQVQPWLPYTIGSGLTNYYGTQPIRIEGFSSGSSRLVGQTENGGSIATYDFGNVSVISLLLFFEFSKAYDIYSSTYSYNTQYLKPAASVQWAAEKVYEYYFKKQNRNSFDNKGTIVKSYVHVDQNLDNAFWLGNANLIAFGDGANNNPLVELDIVGHEFTHGVTQYEAGLQYYNEPGALNESFSDILGKAIEHYTFGDTATWQLAKHYSEGGLRDMSNPNLKNQPDTYSGDFWYTGYDDSGGVHYNSGVQNFWYYLLCEGGSGVNDKGQSYAVNSIGMEAATNIVYRNLTEYIGSSSDYLDSRIGSMLAATDLFGKSSEVYQEVDKAWDAVGVIDEPIITNFDLYDITATTVKLRGNLQPRGDTVSYHFEYGTTPDDFSSSSIVYDYTGSVDGIVTGLQSETKYYIRLVATNENGNSYAYSEFTTLSLAPLVKIVQTVDVTESTATLYGEVNPNSLPTSFYFEYGPTLALGLVTDSVLLKDTTEFLKVSLPIINLQPRQKYYYQLHAINDFSISTSETVSFFTATKPIINSFAPLSGIAGTEVTIVGQNFNPTPEKNIVSFGSTRASIITGTSTELKVNVPVGASFDPITLLDIESGLRVESGQQFLPTYAGEFTKNDLTLRVGISDINLYRVLVEDMDGDERPDIVAIHNQGFSVYQNINQGGDITDNSFYRNTVSMESSLGDLSLVDFDGNGLKDIVGPYQNGVRIYPNLSTPGYIFFGAPVDLSTGYLRQLVYSDFDQDGHIDIGGLSYIAGDSVLFHVYRNQNPQGNLSASNFEQRFQMILPYYVYYLLSDDLNNDGKAELISSPYNKNYIPILKNNSQPGAFDFEETQVEDLARGRFVRYFSQDLNQDGWHDLVSFAPLENGNFSLLENKNSSDISFEAPAIFFNDNTQTSVASGDINGDGKADMVVGISNRKFLFLENNWFNDPLVNTSFQKHSDYGIAVTNVGSGTVTTRLKVNDLNGDGRPDVIKTNAYNYGPHEGYYFEIWQNSSTNCIDPALVTVDVIGVKASINLPLNTTIDQYEIAYTIFGSTYWNTVSTATIDLYASTKYQLRVRAKCYLGYSEYYYINFTSDCTSVDGLTVGNIGVNSVSIYAYNLSLLTVQYSVAGEQQWSTVPQNVTQISSLLPGTTYDLRVKANCNTSTQYKYSQFTTLCPKLISLLVSNITYNSAKIIPSANAIIEYSSDNKNWNLVDETRTITSLIPGKQYYVRGKRMCDNANSDFITTSFSSACPQVSILTASDITPFGAHIAWIDESNTFDYTITYNSLSGSKVTESTNSTHFDIQNLSPGGIYLLTVSPQCTGLKKFTSTSFNTVCYTPYNLTVSSIDYTSAELNWSDNYSGSPYFIDYSISGTNVWTTQKTISTTWALSELRPATRYQVRVHINCLDQMAANAELEFETNHYSETTIAPNPTEDKITIYPGKDLIGKTYSIHDNGGRKIANGILQKYSIDLHRLAPGVYTLNIESEKSFRIIKQ